MIAPSALTTMGAYRASPSAVDRILGRYRGDGSRMADDAVNVIRLGSIAWMSPPSSGGGQKE